jgi:hypothetical protein
MQNTSIEGFHESFPRSIVPDVTVSALSYSGVPVEVVYMGELQIEQKCR